MNYNVIFKFAMGFVVVLLTLNNAESESVLSRGKSHRHGKGKGKKAKMCPSPGGWHPCDCLHEVDSRSRIDEIRDELGNRQAVIRFPNGTSKTLDECPYKRPKPPHRHTGRRGANGGLQRPSDQQPSDGPCQLGWSHATPFSAFYQHSQDIKDFTATYTVPEPPKDTGTDANLLYYWIGLQNTNSLENPVIQPVLSWVPGASSNNWYFESWNCCPAGHKLKASSVAIAGAGSIIQGHMHRDVATGLFNITSVDATGRSSVLYSNDTSSGIVSGWNWVEIVLETYRVADCSQYSAGGLAQFRDILLIDVQGQPVTPKWTQSPYINAKYLTTEAAAEFAACCNGSFQLGRWPDATMHQNGP